MKRQVTTTLSLLLIVLASRCPTGESGCGTSGMSTEVNLKKIHVAVDIRKKKVVVSLEVTSEEGGV
jgi:hypothetical protein